MQLFQPQIRYSYNSLGQFSICLGKFSGHKNKKQLAAPLSLCRPQILQMLATNRTRKIGHKSYKCGGKLAVTRYFFTAESLEYENFLNEKSEGEYLGVLKAFLLSADRRMPQMRAMRGQQISSLTMEIGGKYIECHTTESIAKTCLF